MQGAIFFTGNETNRSFTNSSLAVVPGLSFSYVVPAGSNRIAVTWNSECFSSGVTVLPRDIYGRITVNGSGATGDTGDSLLCQVTSSQVISQMRAFDVTPGSTVTVAVEARAVSATGNLDDNFFTIIPGSQ